MHYDISPEHARCLTEYEKGRISYVEQLERETASLVAGAGDSSSIESAVLIEGRVRSVETEHGWSLRVEYPSMHAVSKEAAAELY